MESLNRMFHNVGLRLRDILFIQKLVSHCGVLDKLADHYKLLFRYGGFRKGYVITLSNGSKSVDFAIDINSNFPQDKTPIKGIENIIQVVVPVLEKGFIKTFENQSKLTIKSTHTTAEDFLNHLPFEQKDEEIYALWFVANLPYHGNQKRYDAHIQVAFSLKTFGRYNYHSSYLGQDDIDALLRY